MSSEDEPLLLEEPAEVKVEESGLAGVEQVEDSRFVDHTNVTPWESLCNSIQQHVKLNSSGNAETKTLEFYCEGQSHIARLRIIRATKASSNDRIRKLFGFSDYISLFSDAELTSLTPSTKSYMLSSLITGTVVSTADKSLAEIEDEVVLPAFLQSKSHREIYGYLKASQSYGVDCVKHYLSQVFEDVTLENPMYYFDGIITQFFKQLSNYSNRVEKIVLVSLVESYYIDELSVLDSHNGNKPIANHPVTLNTLEDLWFPGFDPSFYTGQHVRIAVRLNWTALKHTNIIENSRFSTFQPQKLPPQCWSAEILSTTEDIDSCFPLSLGLRRLLVLYILGISCKEHSSVSDFIVSLPNILSVHSCVDFTTAKRFVENLSKGTIRVFDDLMKSSGSSVGLAKQSANDYLMKLNARLLWINRKEYETLSETLPWEWQKQLGSAPVGSWMSLASLYIASQTTVFDMVTLWTSFVQDLRQHYETDVSVQRLYPPMPIDNSSTCSSPIRNSDKARSVLDRLYWDDVIDKKRLEGCPFSLPDNSKSIAYQQLEMLQMCIVTKEEPFFTSVVPSLSSAATLLESHDFEVPQLLRRLPVTEDSHLQRLQMSTSIGSSSDEDNPPPLLRWQVSHPAIVADCRAFKAKNPNAKCEDFIAFYAALSGPDIVIGAEIEQVLVNIFSVCDPITTEEQKPLFKASMEGEKALNFIERMSVPAIAAALFTDSIASIHFMLFYLSPSLRDCVLFQKRLCDMSTKGQALIDKLKPDFLISNDSSMENSDRIDILSDLNEFCCLIEETEKYIVRFNFLETMKVPRRLAYLISDFSGEIKAETAEEAKALYDLARRASQSQESEWQSNDGRQLGTPAHKSYQLSISSDRDTAVDDLMRVDIAGSEMRVSTMFSEYYYY